MEKKDGIESNPYLENPDIESVDGKIYTKKNPALMTREISEITDREGLYSFHITSTIPLNPNNKPDEFESVALKLFEQGEKEYYEKVKMNKETYFRYIAPLYTEKSCLECHGKQGYEVGSVRGGISVTFNISNAEKALAKNTNLIIILTVITSCIVLGIIQTFIFRLRRTVTDLNELKNKFLAMAAHDLRNPLVASRDFSEMLLDEELGSLKDEQKEVLSLIHESSDYMLNMVSELLDVSVIESGKLELQLSPGTLREVLEERVRISQNTAQKKNIRLHATYSEIPEAVFDKRRIVQVVDNLISNAIKYSPQDTNIYIYLEQVGQMAKVRVCDEGPGISPKDQEKLFGEFQRLSARPTAGESSTGLGLSIAKKIVEAHQGTIGVESELGSGATFYFTIPLE